MVNRSDHIREIKEKIKQNQIIIYNRYYFSTISYGSTLGLNKKGLEAMNNVFPALDLTIILRIEKNCNRKNE